MTSSEIRNSFLRFFEERGHTVVPSSPVVPYDDPTLLFANAGMNQFKDVFLDTGRRPYKRAVDTQKCIRVSGKHNDLEEVGRDTYHHTFFEMLGNWSFGDYYKKEAIEWGWELLTKVWGLPKNRLWATVYKDDDEAEQLWKKVTDIDPTHVLRFGEKDNFWEMGETGPCGPCSEIHMDRTPKGNAPATLVNAGLPDMMEIWNLVFIQYNRDENGKLTLLPAKHVDTGMGFERICAVLQNKDSNYDTDVFSPLLNRISEITGKSYQGVSASNATDRSRGKTGVSQSMQQSEIDVAFRVVADHVRALTFAIADGAIPSNEGRGYVLRRLLRRAARFGRNLGVHEPFIHRLVPMLTETMGASFPEIMQKGQHIEKVIKGEEEGFNATLDRGLSIFEEMTARAKNEKSNLLLGEDVFKLYDTYGFPLDLTRMLGNEQGLGIDEEGFVKLMNQQQERSRNVTISPGTGTITFTGYEPTVTVGDLSLSATRQRVKNLGTVAIEKQFLFLGYDKLESEIEVNSCVDNILVSYQTPFYGESGGQVGDTGIITVGAENLTVIDTQKAGSINVHILAKPFVWQNPLGTKALARVDAQRRLDIMRNHTATHIVHEALRRVLDEHLHQHGSLVDNKHLRFDFNHFDKVSPDQLQAIEDLVNEKIADNIEVVALNDPKQWVTIDEAKKRWPNVKMFFGDKYGEKVRVVEIDPKFSVELCGGTHVKSTSEIGFFKFRTEGSVASGIRRIEAVTHDFAFELLKVQEKSLGERLDYALQELNDAYNALEELSKAGDESASTKKASLQKLEERTQKLKNAPTFPRITDGKLGLYFKQQANRSRVVEDGVLELLEIKKGIEKELSRHRLKSLSGSIDHLVNSGVAVNGFKVVSSKVTASSTDELKSLGDTLRAKLGSGVGLLAAVIDDKVSLVCVVTDDLVAAKKIEAGKIVGAVAKLVGGGGGGRAHMATAGGKDVGKLDEALAQTKSIVESLLHGS